jgi:hypothetical protein
MMGKAERGLSKERARKRPTKDYCSAGKAMQSPTGNSTQTVSPRRTRSEWG